MTEEASDPYRAAGSRRLAQGIVFDLDRMYLTSPAGRRVRRDVVRHPGGVAVLPVDGEAIWLIRQRRAPFGRLVDEVPAGRRELGDPGPEAAARRELAEELGATAERWSWLGRILPSPGYTSEVIEIYAAEDLTFGERRPDGEEEHGAEVFSVPWDEAVRSIDEGRITDAKTVVAVLQWQRRRA